MTIHDTYLEIDQHVEKAYVRYYRQVRRLALYGCTALASALKYGAFFQIRSMLVQTSKRGEFDPEVARKAILLKYCRITYNTILLLTHPENNVTRLTPVLQA